MIPAGGQGYMTKAVIFDCFGVLTTDGWLAFRDTYFPQDDERRREVDELNRQTDAGLLSTSEFEEAVARLAGVGVGTVHESLHTHVGNELLFDYIIQNLKPLYKIGLLSNASEDVTPELFTISQNAVFDEKVFSFELGVLKPHSAMYETIAMKLGVLPEESIYIDDRQAFVEGAAEIGMNALRYHDMLRFRKDFEELVLNLA